MRQSAFADREVRAAAQVRASSKRVVAIFPPCGHDASSDTKAAFGGHEMTRKSGIDFCADARIRKGTKKRIEWCVDGDTKEVGISSLVFRAAFAARRLLCPAKRVFVSRCLPEPKVGRARRRLTKVDWNWNIEAAFNVLQFDLQVKTTMRHSSGEAARQAAVVRDCA